MKSVVKNITKPFVDNDKDIPSTEETRRVIAEDPEWSLAIVPLFKDLIIDHIAKNFASE